MKQTWEQNYAEIKAAYKSAYSAPKQHGEEVVMFHINFYTATSSNGACFEAPRCSTNEELMMYAYYQVESSTLKSIIVNSHPCYDGWKEKITFRLYTPPSIA